MEQDLRLREVQVNVEQNGGGEGGVPRNNRGHSVAMKALKLPLFNEEKDDLDAYLIRFERACTAFEIRPEFWSTQLARLLQGRSLDVYQRLPAEEVDNYESLSPLAGLLIGKPFTGNSPYWQVLICQWTFRHIGCNGTNWSELKTWLLVNLMRDFSCDH